MFTNKVEVLTMARAKAAHAAGRQGIIAGNVANADTPGYRARDLVRFADVWESRGFTLRESRAGHLPGHGRLPVAMMRMQDHINPNGNSVSLEAEMVRAAEARLDHDMALAVYRSLSGSIRATLGKR